MRGTGMPCDTKQPVLENRPGSRAVRGKTNVHDDVVRGSFFACQTRRVARIEPLWDFALGEMRDTIAGGYPAGARMTNIASLTEVSTLFLNKALHPQPRSQMQQHLICETLLITFSTCRQEFPSNWPMVKNTLLSSSSSWLLTHDFVCTSLFVHKHSSRKESLRLR